MAKRRTPPLFEVLSAPDRRPGPGVGGGVLNRPIKVDLPHPAGGTNGSHAASAMPAAPDAARRRAITYWCIGIATVMALVIGVYLLAFRMGRENKAQEIAPWLHEAGPTPPPTGGSSGPGSPLNSPSTLPPVVGGSGTQPGADQPVTPPEMSADSTSTLTDPRKPGNNYLHLAQLNWKDAERAVAYLNQHGVPAAAVPAKAVDPQEARAKNQPHLVFALEAIPSDQFKSSERKRQDLVEKVRRIGKKWQAEEKGPSDFGEPNWARFK